MTGTAGTSHMSDQEAQLSLLHPVESTRIFETVGEQLISMIERLGLSAGDRLPNIAELAHALDVSKPTVREALRILERSGVVRVQRGRLGGGVYVSQDTVPMSIVAAEVFEVEDHILHLLAARRMVEGLASHLAAAIASAEALDAVERTIELSKRHHAEPAMLVRTDGMFHRAIARATQNEVLEKTVAGILRQLMPLRDVWGSAARLSQTGKDQAVGAAPSLTADAIISLHERHLAAVREGDSAMITEILDEHFSWLEELFATASGRGMDELFELAPRELIGSLTGRRTGRPK